MGGFIVRVILACLAALLFVLLLWPKALFVIRITGGKPRAQKGRVPKGFLGECELLARENNITDLTIRGLKKKGIVSLKFSGRIPDAVQQRFRNVWKQYT